jgi:peptidoglycan-associated lipoprotein
MSQLKQVAPALLALLTWGCTPKYPKCDKDAHCQTEGRQEFCINGQCQQCRDAKDCPPGQMCKGGRCEAKTGFCESSTDCPNGLACKNNRCTPCASDADCEGGAKCKSGRCISPGQCASNADCPENHECQEGRCVAPPSPGTGTGDPCASFGLPSLAPVYFDFNDSILTTDATKKILANLQCIKKVQGRTLRVEGHADPRGTDEYNLALGDRRAQSVQGYLQRLGVPLDKMRAVSKGKLEATGTDDGGWARDRKVLFIWE